MEDRVSGGGSATEQIGEKAQQLAGTAQEKAGELAGRAQEASGMAQDRVRGELDRRSSDAGEQLLSVADVMRHTSGELRSRGNEPHAKLAETAAERIDRLGGYLTNADADQMLEDIENLARRQPVLVAAGGLLVGFAAARFIKASSDRRYADRSGMSRDNGWQQLPAATQLPGGTYAAGQ